MLFDKFKELGVELSGKPAKSPEQQIAAVESLIGRPLPESYRQMLLTFKTAFYFTENVGFTPIEPSPWAGEDGTLDIVEFYGPKRGDSGLAKAVKTFREQMPEAVIPIADSSGGNQICLGIEGEVQGKVFFWDHEGESDDSQSFDDLTLVAESFEDFIERLEVLPEDELGDDGDYDDDDIWIDESLL